MIPNAAVYRIYGDSLAIIMNVKTKRTVLLKEQALHFWKDILNTNRVDSFEKNRSLYNRLVGLGVLDDLFDRSPSIPSENAPFHNAQEIDIGILNLWAFKNRIPISGHFELTGRCNLRCRHCYGLFDTKKDSLSTEQVLGILDDLRDSGTFGLVLTGGELFFRQDILDILTYLNEQKFIVRINSNGTLITESVVKAMQELTNIYRIHISLYSAEPEIHDRITKAPGSYYKTLYALRLLQEAGFDLRINCSVMKSNIDTYQKVRDEIGDKMGIPVHFDTEIFPRDDGGTENLTERLDTDQIQRFIRGNAAKKAAPPKQKLCKAGFSFFSICEDGSLLPCLKMKRYYRFPLGRLTLNSFSEIWQGSEAVLQIRDSIENQLKECELCTLSI